MKRIIFSLGGIAIALFNFLHAAPAQAQARVFVAGQGSDSNPCTFALPCRTFQHAHDTVVTGGEINVLDPAGYGGLTISKAISIQGHGYAGLSVGAGATGITINAGANDEINLSGLIIDGSDIGSKGIRFNSGLSLSIADCAVRNLLSSGLDFSNASTAAASLSVSNAYFTDNLDGIVIRSSSSGSTTGTITRVIFANNHNIGLEVNGFSGTGALDVAVTDSVASASNLSGFEVTSRVGHSVSNLVLTRSAAVGNSKGVFVSGATATVWLAQSTVTRNSTGYSVSSVNPGVINSYGDNYLAGNGDNSGTLTPVAKE